MDRTSGLDVKGQIKLEIDTCGLGDDVTLEAGINGPHFRILLIFSRYVTPVNINEGKAAN